MMTAITMIATVVLLFTIIIVNNNIIIIIIIVCMPFYYQALDRTLSCTSDRNGIVDMQVGANLKQIVMRVGRTYTTLDGNIVQR